MTCDDDEEGEAADAPREENDGRNDMLPNDLGFP